jgi:hypothetical protein
MTLDEQRAWEERDLARRTLALRRLVEGKLSDASAHALKVLTYTLDGTTEGRPTIAKIRQSPSYSAAVSRLRELESDLAEQISDCRRETYEQAYDFWWNYHAPEQRNGQEPYIALSKKFKCVNMVLHGYSTAFFISAPIDRAVLGLLPALTVAGNRATDSRAASALIRRWEQTSTRSIVQTGLTALVDSQTLADRMAGRDSIKAEYLYPDPQLD